MTVDLNRLREARWQSNAEAREALAEAGMAVLDAPIRWWCEVDKFAYTVVACHHDGCGWVALVPVKGETE